MHAGVHRRHDRRFVSGLPRERHVVNDETEPSTSGGSASRNPPLRPKNSLTDPSLMFGVGPLAAFLLAGGLVSWRDDIGTTNVALLIGLVVVIAATADRAAGVATALVAAFSYNFFHTQPYRSLRIDDGVDVLTVVLLLVIGLVVSEINAPALTVRSRSPTGTVMRSMRSSARASCSRAEPACRKCGRPFARTSFG